jgi:hypothetical protein
MGAAGITAACLWAALASGAGPAPTTKLISVSSAETKGDSDSQYNVAITPNARFVAFQSSATNLASGDSDSFYDVFLRDRKKGKTTLVSREKNASANDGSSAQYGLDMTPDHRFVAFDSDSERLVPHDDNGFDDVFVRDLKQGETKLVSVSSSGKKTDGSSAYNLHISANGRFVAFASDATKLVPHDDNGATDVFVRDLRTRKTTLVSTAIGGGPGGGPSGQLGLDMSANGRLIAFESAAEDLHGADNGARDVFVRDRRTGKTSVVSVTSSGDPTSADSQGSVISPNGRYVAFSSQADGLAGADANGHGDVFIRDRKHGKTRLVSVASNGVQGDDSSGFQAVYGYETMGVSGDGRFVEFDSYAENLVGNDGNGWIDVFLRDTKTHQTSLVSEALGGSSGSDESAYYSAAMTPDARFVAFNSGADDLTSADTNSDYDFFLRGPLR